MWSKASRSYEKLPKIKSTQQYAVAWKRWWLSLQPPSRIEDANNPWPPARREPANDEEWTSVRRGGPNGMFLVVISLGWWLWATVDAGEPLAGSEIEVAVGDVLWVCQSCLATCGETRKRVAEDADDQPEGSSVAKRPKRACRRT